VPRVPEYEQPKVTIAPMPGVRQNANAPIEAFGGATARAMRQGGQDLVDTGNVIAKVELQRLDEDNRAAAWDAYTKLSDQERDYLYNAETGQLNKKSGDTLGLTDNVAKNIGGMAEKLSGVLKNDDQRRLFKELYQKRLDSTLDSVARYEATERRNYRDQQYEGVRKSVEQDAATRWNDPVFIDKSADLAVTAMVGNLRSKGTAQELIDAEVAAMKSGVWASAISQAVQVSPLDAKKLLDANRTKLTGEDAAKLDKLIEVPLRAAKATAEVSMVMNPTTRLPGELSSKIAKAAAAEGVDVTTALTIAQIENPSGDPSAKNPNSSARGVYQFVDKTWKSMGGTDADRGNIDKQVELGVRHIKQNREGLRTSLGREPTPAEIYLAHQQGLAGAKALLSAGAGVSAIDALVPAYEGDRAAATAAVVNNGGSANTTAADFVAKWNRKVSRGSASMSTSSDLSLSDMITVIKARTADDPELQKAAIAELKNQYATMEAAKKDDQEAAMERIYGHFLQTGTYAGASPADLAKLDNKTLITLQEKARDVKTNWAYYDDFMAKSPAERAKVPLEQLMTNLGPTELRSAIKERRDNKGGDSKQPWLQTRGAILKDFAVEAGLASSGDKQTTEQQTKYNALSSYMNTRMDAYRAKHGEEMPENLFRQEAARAVTKVVTSKGTFFDSKANVFELNGQPVVSISKISDMPQSMRAEIETSIRAQGKQVTEELTMALGKAWIAGDANGAKLLLQGAK
jgi:hypothetical protein